MSILERFCVIISLPKFKLHHRSIMVDVRKRTESLHLLSLRYPTVAMVPECRTITHSSDRTNDARSRISSSTVQLWTAFLLSLVAEVEAIAADFKIEDRMDVEEDHFEEVALFQLVEVEVDLDLVDISHIRGSHDNNIHSNHRIVLKKSVLLHLIIIQV
jgi:hypothetical protein